MKLRVDKMTTNGILNITMNDVTSNLKHKLLKCQLIKWQVVKMTSLQIDQLMKWSLDNILS
jgi:hypothetical protein